MSHTVTLVRIAMIIDRKKIKVKFCLGSSVYLISCIIFRICVNIKYVQINLNNNFN